MESIVLHMLLLGPLDAYVVSPNRFFLLCGVNAFPLEPIISARHFDFGPFVFSRAIRRRARFTTWLRGRATDHHIISKLREYIPKRLAQVRRKYVYAFSRSRRRGARARTKTQK